MRTPALTRAALCAAVLLLLGVGPGRARGDFLTFNRSAAFFNAVGSAAFVTEGYEGVALDTVLPTGTTLNGVSYTFPVGVSGRVDNTFNFIGTRSLEAQRGATPSFFFPGDSIVVAFAQPVFGVGIFINAGVSATSSDYFLSTPVGTATTGGPNNYDFSTFYFVGLLSDTPFTTATIGSLAVGPSTGHNVDNLTRVQGLPSAFAVPEPSSFALLGLGALGLLGYGWRRRKGAERKGGPEAEPAR